MEEILHQLGSVEYPMIRRAVGISQLAQDFFNTSDPTKRAYGLKCELEAATSPQDFCSKT